jgi:diguanylate cyclase (GGDEF)-like protein
MTQALALRIHALILKTRIKARTAALLVTAPLLVTLLILWPKSFAQRAVEGRGSSSFVVVAIAFGYFMAERYAVRLAVSRFNINYAPSEVPILFGAALLSPNLHLAIRVIATGIATFARLRKGNRVEIRLKIVLNCIMGAFDVGACLSVVYLTSWDGSIQTSSLATITLMWLACILPSTAIFLLAQKLGGHRVVMTEEWTQIRAQLGLSGLTMAVACLLLVAVQQQPAVGALTAIIVAGLYPLIKSFLKASAAHKAQVAYGQLTALLTQSDSEDLGPVLEVAARVSQTQTAQLVVLGHQGFEVTDTVLLASQTDRSTLSVSDLPQTWQEALETGVTYLRTNRDGMKDDDLPLTNSEIVTPLLNHGAVIGLLVGSELLDEIDGKKVKVFDPTQAATVAGYMAIWLEKARLVTQLRSEITERTQQALHDPLTGLLNRRGFHEAWERVMADPDEHQLVGVLLIDLDNFKDVNTHSGHEGGDLVLQQVSERLVKTLPKRSIVGRLGGDEFAVIIPGIREPRDASDFAFTTRKALATAHVVFNEELEVGGSIGVSVYPKHGKNISDLLKNADAAMFAAKDETSVGVSVYAMHHLKSSDRGYDSYRLRDAIESNHITAWYQPIIDMSTYRVAGFEALARWENKGEFISPAEFIPLAERSGHIHNLTRKIMTEALINTERWNKAMGIELHIGVNLSPVCIGHPDTIETLKALLASTTLNPSSVMIEVTESRMLRDPARAAKYLDELKALGVHIALDDFGTGASTHEWLKRITADVLKIDKMFIDDVASSQQSAGIVEVDMLLAKTFGMSVIAEGIETIAQWDACRSLGVHYAQGYLAGRPMPARVVGDWLKTIEPHIENSIALDRSLEPIVATK